MQLYLLSEATAARRRTYLHLVDATDGITAETGEAAGQPQFSKNGAAFANTSATLTAVGNGLYYVEHTTGELDTLGVLAVRYKSANTAEAQAICQVVAFNPFDSVRLGLTALPAAAAEAAGGLYTRGSGAGQINQDVNGRVDARTVAISTGAIQTSTFAAGAVDAAAFSGGLRSDESGDRNRGRLGRGAPRQREDADDVAPRLVSRSAGPLDQHQLSVTIETNLSSQPVAANRSTMLSPFRSAAARLIL